jgi:hypothetical protein
MIKKFNKKMNKLKLAYIVLVVSVALLIGNLYRIDYNNIEKSNYFGIISNLLLIILMVISIRDLKKVKEK